MRQEQRIYEYMKKHNGITAKEAVEELGVMRLSARIFDLREQGINISDERVKGVNRYGETCYYTRYKVVDTDE